MNVLCLVSNVQWNLECSQFKHGCYSKRSYGLRIIETLFPQLSRFPLPILVQVLAIFLSVSHEDRLGDHLINHIECTVL